MHVLLPNSNSGVFYRNLKIFSVFPNTDIDIFQAMTQEQKNLLSYLLQDMARADGHVDDCERTYWTKLNGELKFTNLEIKL